MPVRPLPLTLILLAAALRAAAFPAHPESDDACTRDIWEQQGDGRLVLVRRNICGRGESGDVTIWEGVDEPGVVGPPEPVGKQTPLSPADVDIVPMERQTDVPPASSTTTTTAATTTTTTPATTTPAASTTPGVPTIQSIVPPPSTSGLSASKLLLLKKLKLLALGALLLG